MKLARLLGEPERKIRRISAKLEELSGYNSEDVRLLAESEAALKRKIADLRLDPQDTHGEELYEALKVKLAQDLAHLDRAWGLQGENDLFQIAKVLEHVNPADKLLAIKCSVVKKMMASQKPKRTTKILGYRSLDSMLKHEDSRLVLAVAMANESAHWQSKMARAVSRLHSSDYEVRKVKFVPARGLSADITTVPLMAAVCISAKANGAQSVIHGVSALVELIDANNFLSNRQFSANFNKAAERVFSGHYDEYLAVDGHEFISHSSLLKLDDEKHSVHEIMAGVHPLLTWWAEAGHLAMDADGPVSLNLHDCLDNLLADATYEYRQAGNFVNALKHKLFEKYYAYQGVKNYLIPAVDDTLISIDGLNPAEIMPEFEEALT